jgi:recombination protein RecT
MTNNLAVIEKNTMDLLNNQWSILKKYSKTSDNKALEITRTATLAVMESPKLQDALKTEKGQISFIHSMKLALRTGLSLNPQEGKAALIPYAGEVKYQIMKNGMLEIANESPAVKLISSKVIFKNDKFRIWEDEKGCHYVFEPALSDRGEALGYVAIIAFTDSSVHAEYMSIEQVKEHKKKHVKYDSDAWKNSFDGMAKKTVLKSLLRNVTVSPEVSEAIGIDDNIDPENQVTEKSEIDELNERIKKNSAIPTESKQVEPLTEEEKQAALADEAKEGEKEND